MTIEISSHNNVTIKCTGTIKIQAEGDGLFPIEISVEDLYKKIKGKNLDNPLGLQRAVDLKVKFNDFWGKYGRKEKKKAALKIWNKLPDADIDEILRTVEFFVKAHPDVKFRPLPSTYLNDKRWEDELPEHITKTKPALSWAKPNTWGASI